MKKYRTYPIYINHNKFTAEERAGALSARDRAFYSNQVPGRIGGANLPGANKLENIFNPYAKKYLAEQEEYMRKHGDVADWQRYYREQAVDTQDKAIDEIKAVRATPESIAYEKGVYQTLDVIRGTVIGSLLLNSLGSSVKIWILFDESGPGVASTTPGVLGSDLGGGVRLHFNPGDFDPKMEYYTPDDVLFHELVHAYRSAKGENHSIVLPEYQTAEELLAIHMQNVYMAMRGKKRFYLTHSNPKLASKDEIYERIASDKDTLNAFNYFLNHEPFTKKVAAMKFPIINAWRDAAQINALSPASAGTGPLTRFGLPMTF